jgi:hypothetical protein
MLAGVEKLVTLPSSSVTVLIPGTEAAVCIAPKDAAIASICWSVIPFPIAPATAFAIAPTTPIVGAFSAMFIKPRPMLCAVLLIPCPVVVPPDVGLLPPSPLPTPGITGAVGALGACVASVSVPGVVGVVGDVGVVGAVVEPVNSVYPEGIGN